MTTLTRPSVDRAARVRFVLTILTRAGIAAALSLACFFVYHESFSKFARWDDEGYLLFEVRYFLRGHVLYDDVYAQYGPFYFLVQWVFFKALEKPVSHDLMRIFAAIQWGGSATLLAWCVRSVTRSWIVTGFAFFAILKTLSDFTEGAGHPQSLCLLLVACLLALSCNVKQTIRPWTAAVFGFLVAAVALTKVNSGYYLGTAVLLAMLKTDRSAVWKRYLFWAVGITSLISIPLIMAPLFRFDWDRSLCLLIVISVLAALSVASVTGSFTTAGRRTWLSLGTGAAASAVLIPLPFLLHGTTLSMFLWMTVFQYRDFARNWYHEFPCTPIFVVYAAASLAFAAVLLLSRTRERRTEKLEFYLQLTKGAAGVAALAIASVEDPYANAVLPFQLLAPLLWMVLVPPRQAREERLFARLTLCLVAVYLTMYAFPVAGAQVNFSVSLALVAAGIFVADAWTALEPVVDPRWLTADLRVVAPACLLLFMAAIYVKTAKLAYSVHKYQAPLGFAGAERIRLTKQDAETYKWLVRQIDARCDSFFSMPGIFSLYFWVNQEPPTLRASSAWMILMDPAHQQAVVEDLSRHQHRSCIVYNPMLVEFWRKGQDLTKQPLANYIKENFVPAAEYHGYFVLVHKPGNG